MKFIYTLVFLIASASVFAQDINFKAIGPKYVRVGEQFQVQYSVNKNIDDFSPPSFDGFDFLGGPMQGSSTNISVINGKTVRNQTFTFTYYLRASKAGNFTIPPAKVKYKKTVVESNSVGIEVVGGNNAGTSSQNNSAQGGEKSPAAKNSSSEDLFVSLITDKKSVYVGESITGWIKIYTKVSLSDIDRSYKGPVFSGFYKQNIEVPPIANLEREKVGDDIYYTGVLQKVILFPQKSGKITIAPFDLTVYMQKQIKQSRSVFDDFFGPSYKSVPVKLKSKPVNIQVKALPDNQPEGFTGAVGNFSIKGTLNSNKVKTNDAVSFNITLSGNGNIKLIESLDYTMPSTMQVYDPIVKTRIDKSGRSGSKTFEITAIPRHAGTINIKPFKLVYFDTKSKSYKTIQTQAYTLEVERGEGDSNSVVISNLSKEDVELLSSDIRYLKTIPKLQKKGSYLIDSIFYRLVYVLLLILFIAVLILKKEQIKRNANISHTKHKKASKIAAKRFKKAKEFLKANKIDLFYEEMSKAMWGYLSDKLGIAQSSLSIDTAKEALIKYEIDSALTDELFAKISDFEFARYAPGGGSINPQNAIDDAVKLLMKIEQKF